MPSAAPDEEIYDVVVCGGGLAGFCAAVAAARQGSRTCLVHDRPVFGGNSSSEVRVTPHGAAQFHAYARETGIISELLTEERARNHEEIFENGWTNSVWDMVLYDMAASTPRLAFHLNTSVHSVLMNHAREIAAVRTRTPAAERERVLRATTFIDCTGDGTVAHLAGCTWRMGTEAAGEFQEPHAPPQASGDVMGSSILIKTRHTGAPAPYRPPAWAASYDDASFFYQQGRDPSEIRGGFWWIEIGMPWHTIHDNEAIRHELTRHALGVWDWIKNKDPRLKGKALCYALDWIGQVPGKRESRRIAGQYLMTEHDPQNRTVFPDEIAFGGWFIDLHTPGGLLAASSEPMAALGQDSAYAAKSYAGPYGIPLRILVSRDVDNLLMAGRNVSVTHAALGTVRVMNTTALLGQAAGTAADAARRHRIPAARVTAEAIQDVQQTLLREGCFLPNFRNQDPLDLARQATVRASSEFILGGAGPESTWASGGLRWVGTACATLDDQRLVRRRGQWLHLSGPRLETIEVCLSNLSTVPQRVRATLQKTDGIWDYRVETGATLAATVLEVPPGEQQWIPWKTDWEGEAACARLDLEANPEVVWHISGAIVPGHPCAQAIDGEKMRRYQQAATLSFRLHPGQLCYGPSQILSGVTRPHSQTNLWRSRPGDAEPWITLEWPQPVELGWVQATFPGHLLKHYHSYPPYFRDPQTPKDYSIHCRQDGHWHEVVRVEGNYQQRRRHRLPAPVRTDALRCTLHATHGDPSGAIYEIRCYAGTPPGD